MDALTQALGMSPRDFIDRFRGLGGVVEPLSELIRVNPSLRRDIIELAIVYGIQAGLLKAAEVPREEMIERLGRNWGRR